MNGQEKVGLPVLEAALLKAVQSLAIDYGTVAGPGAAGGNTVTDSLRNWAPHIHINRLVKIVSGLGAGQQAIIQDNSATTLLIRGTWPQAIGAGAVYMILGMDIAQMMRGIYTPLEQALQHNVVVVAATDILGTAIVPVNIPCRFLVEIAFSAIGLFSVRLTNGGVAVDENFNHGVNLTANDLFRFSHLVHAGDTVNYRYSVNATMLSMRVQEVME